MEALLVPQSALIRLVMSVVESKRSQQTVASGGHNRLWHYNRLWHHNRMWRHNRMWHQAGGFTDEATEQLVGGVLFIYDKNNDAWQLCGVHGTEDRKRRKGWRCTVSSERKECLDRLKAVIAFCVKNLKNGSHVFRTC